MLLRQRNYRADGTLDWRASVEASLAGRAKRGGGARIGRISRLLTPGLGACQRCQTTWAFVEGHSTRYSDGQGCFPLCEKCWRDLGTPEARMPFYRALYELWLLGTRELPYGPVRFSAIEAHRSAWPLIEAAVRAGR